MDTVGMILAALVIAAAGLCVPARAQESVRDHTCFQVAAPYSPAIDVGSDVAIVYGVGGNFAERAAVWREKGYTVSMMTGIAWGDYGAYYQTEHGLKEAEIQTTKSGRLYMHGNSTTVGYNVPSADYVEFIKAYIDPAIDDGVKAIYFEEPEYWAETGWSEGFKKEWELFYGTPWEAPDTSVDAQYRASRLKYELYYDALKEAMAHVKRRAKEKGIEIECHVPTHSLVNYAQWRIVSPESHLMDLPDMDGYIAQVWTGTARSANVFRGVRKSRTFETAYFEYGQMLSMVRPTGRKVWFLHDPVEDDPNHGWDDYKLNYECTVIASLFWPEVSRFEVMPWPDRIFLGKRPRTEADRDKGERVPIPQEYAAQVLTIVNALNDMEQEEVHLDAGTEGVGVVISDTIMFQRAAPTPSDAHLGSFFGVALPLVKHGIPASVFQLETIGTPGALDPFKVLYLTYEGQKPLKPEYHEALDTWVRGGGSLIFIGDGSDPYHEARSWWNDEGQNGHRAYEDLFRRLEVGAVAMHAPQAVGKGFVRILRASPAALGRESDGADTVVGLLREVLRARGERLETQNYLRLDRGPYVIASVLDESVSPAPLRITGNFIDLFDPRLPHATERVLAPDERVLLYDLDWLTKRGVVAHVVAAGARIRDQRIAEGKLYFTARGPENTWGCARVLLPRSPSSVSADPGGLLERRWDEASSTLWLRFDNRAADVAFTVEFGS